VSFARRGLQNGGSGERGLALQLGLFTEHITGKQKLTYTEVKRENQTCEEIRFPNKHLLV
jgi:hypothetical protein